MTKVLITGGAGYVGSVLAPFLMRHGYDVTVLDRFWYGRDVFDDGPVPRLVEADIRDAARLDDAMRGVDTVLHLACISNDPSFELEPTLGRSINLDAFPGIVTTAKRHGVRHFIYASSSSVYGIRDGPEVNEDSPCEPLTDYSKFKLECEAILHQITLGDGYYTIIRPATVCGYSPRQRLDLTVNILTIHALVNRRIRVFGGSQLRPNLHIQDMAEAYLSVMRAPREKVAGAAFNVGFENRPVADLAKEVVQALGDPGIEIVTEASDDLRSYHISAKRISEVLGFKPRHTITDAIQDLANVWRNGKLPDAMDDMRYYNVRLMKHLLANHRETVFAG
ncbi:MAG: NAD-dependent epimerase/dehydratase family protein [Candidatus Xenobia bacterium]